MGKTQFKVERLSFNGLGTKNVSEFPEEFVQICMMDQKTLKKGLTEILKKYYESVEVDDGYILAKGDYPVVLTAHLDTVHKEVVKEYWGYTNPNGKHIISSPQGIGGDDRCGVFMILEILRTTDYRPTIIFCEDEEIGGVGSEKFTDKKITLPHTKFFIELDRANGNDLVFYNDENMKFQDFCEETTGYKTSYGSFSDISVLCPVYEISGVNISCGYYNAHTTDEYVVLEEMMDGIEATKKLLEKAIEVEKPFKYEESFASRYYNYGYGRDYEWYDNDYSYYYGDKSKKKKKAKGESYTLTVDFFYYDKNFDEVDDIIEAESFVGAVGIFLMEHPELSWADVLDYEVIG